VDRALEIHGAIQGLWLEAVGDRMSIPTAC
jgi:hypothetical protein